MTGRRGKPDRSLHPQVRIPSEMSEEIAMKPHGHTHHVGTCPHCQAQLARWQRQLAAATPKSNLARKES